MIDTTISLRDEQVTTRHRSPTVLPAGVVIMVEDAMTAESFNAVAVGTSQRDGANLVRAVADDGTVLDMTESVGDHAIVASTRPIARVEAVRSRGALEQVIAVCETLSTGFACPSIEAPVTTSQP